MLHRWTKVDLITLADSDRVIRRGSVSVRIWENGTITRLDCALDIARKMTVRETVKLLGLKAHELGSSIRK